MNPFEQKLITDTFSSLTVPYQFNIHEGDPYTINCLVTNGEYSKASTYHIHSLQPFHCGDYLKIDNNSEHLYMVTNDVISKHGHKYKGVIEYCNYQIEKWELTRVQTGTDSRGRPIYEEVNTLVGMIPCVLTFKSTSNTSNDAVNLINDMYEIKVKNNDAAINSFGLNADSFSSVTIYEKEYKIVNVDYSKQGMIRLYVE